jgi:preprotein translocase subunit SecG
MKTLSGKINRKLTEEALEYRNWASENWVSYIFLKNVYFLLFLPSLYLIGQVNVAFVWFIVLMPLSSLVFFLLDSKRISVVERSPAKFIKAEKVERFFDILFWVLYPLWFIVLIVLANGERIGIAKEVMPSFQAFLFVLILSWGGLLFNVELNVIESSKFLKLIKERIVPKPKRQHLFEFYPLEIMRARARFVVVSDFLSGNPDKKRIGKKFSLFYEGLRIYNNHLKEEFGFVLSGPKRFYCQAKLAAYSKDNVDNIKKGLSSLTEMMKSEKSDPFEIIKSLKEMLGESVSFKDICAEIDADPERMRKWFSRHSDSTIGIVGIILAVIAIILPMAFHI